MPSQTSDTSRSHSREQLGLATMNEHDDEEGNPMSSEFFAEEPEDSEQRNTLAKKETTYVRWSRFIVIFFLVGSATLVSSFVYRFTHNDEVAEFEETFTDYAEQITRTVHRNAQNKLEATGAIALQVQAFAVTSGATWPNVTVPFFEERILAMQSLTDAYGVQLFPLVTNETRAGWEAYSVEHRDWINASFFAQRQIHGQDSSRLEPGQTAEPDFDWFDHLWGEKNRHPDNPDFSSGIASRIFGTRFNEDRNPIVDPSDGPLFPQWQVAPMDWYYQTTVNNNYGNYEDFYNQTQIITETGNAAFGMAWSDGNTPGYISTMLYPIFDTFYGDEKPRVAAFIGIDLFWQAFIERILPPNTNGIYVVIKNEPPCDQEFTFQIFGDRAEFIDDGDVHEATERFDKLKQSFLFGSELMEPISEPTYNGRPLYNDFCPYTFTIYPSHELEDLYVTNKPIIYTVVVAAVFLFTSLVFFAYDFLVENRQKLVLKSAHQADAVVSSLFPQAVKEQLYQKEQGNGNNKSGVSGESSQEAQMMKQFMGDVASTANFMAGNADAVKDPQIASLYPETTIFFADLVGFTAWSSSRQPCEVFQLLETLYGAFDGSARKRNVFKVETIGDCYVAVTGLPKPQPQHAVIMVKFANDCKRLMQAELHNLADSLGPATLELQLRIGLHSGPVTAGVLRGDKARFQLFGDSMNTASRMESNSKPGCIHVSEATADQLRQWGKGSWLQLREDKIHAKGKGEMTTYWVHVPSNREGSVRSATTSDLYPRSQISQPGTPQRVNTTTEMRSPAYDAPEAAPPAPSPPGQAPTPAAPMQRNWFQFNGHFEDEVEI